MTKKSLQKLSKIHDIGTEEEPKQYVIRSIQVRAHETFTVTGEVTFLGAVPISIPRVVKNEGKPDTVVNEKGFEVIFSSQIVSTPVEPKPTEH